jgi:predicted CxxxxCH...CXXCH cytochrome family protein
MTRAVSVGRSFNGLWAAGALGLALLTISSFGAGCAGSLDISQFPTGGAGSTGTAGTGAAGTGAAGTMGTAGTGGGTPGCDVTQLISKDACTNAACHDATGTSAAFSMVGNWTTMLVGVKPKGGGALPSVCAKDAAFMNVPYIKKGDPNGDGIFMQKLTGAICSPGGLQMPFGMNAISAADLMCFKQFATALANQ